MAAGRPGPGCGWDTVRRPQPREPWQCAWPVREISPAGLRGAGRPTVQRVGTAHRYTNPCAVWVAGLLRLGADPEAKRARAGAGIFRFLFRARGTSRTLAHRRPGVCRDAPERLRR